MKQTLLSTAINQVALSASTVGVVHAGVAGFASLSAELESDDGWYQLLPAGQFKARDGRPTDTDDGHWHLDGESAAVLIANTKAMADMILIDYEHATLRAKERGDIAPAAAWLSSSDIEWREGKGLYIRPDWTVKAKSLIDSKEYAFLSAVFPYDKKGNPLALRMAAITNDPGLIGLEPIAALSSEFNLNFYHKNGSITLYGQTEDSLVNELLKQLLAKLGIDVPQNGELSVEMQTAALTALDALSSQAGNATTLQTQLAELSARTEPDWSKVVPVETYNALVGQVAALSATTENTSLSQIISEAKQSGKVVEAEVDYLTQFGKQQGVAALSAMLKARPAIAALSATQTKDQAPKEDKQKAADELSDTELAVLSATGLTKEQFLAAKQDK